MKKADILIVVGTSFIVYTAAGMIDYFQGDNLALINRSTTKADFSANVVIHDFVGRVLKEAVEKLS